jgi:hypothetical protein
MRYREKREESVLLHLAEVEEITSLTSVKRMPPPFCNLSNFSRSQE